MGICGVGCFFPAVIVGERSVKEAEYAIGIYIYIHPRPPLFGRYIGPKSVSPSSLSLLSLVKRFVFFVRFFVPCRSCVGVIYRRISINFYYDVCGEGGEA